MRQLLIDRIAGARRFALMTDGALEDIVISAAHRPMLRGSIWKARVRHVVPALGGAFLDLAGHSAFLNYDVAPPVAGSDLIVQVAIDAYGEKQPRVTTQIRLTGRFAILDPFGKGHGISQKIRDKPTRQHLQQLFSEHLDGRVMLRSNAAAAPPAMVTAELGYLRENWALMEEKARAAAAPALLHAAAAPQESIARDWLTPDTQIISADSAALQDISQALAHCAPDLSLTPRFDASAGLFRRMGAEDAIAAARDPVVALPGGGRLGIYETPALVAIDVDSGDAQSWAPDSTAESVNRSAAERIPRELKRRHLGGTVAVDFIGFASHFAKALESLRTALAADPLAGRPAGTGGLGLAVFTRQRLGPSLEEMMRDLTTEDTTRR